MPSPLTNKANRYARDVVSGKIPACLYVKQACHRHLDDLASVKDKHFPYKFDRKKAEKVCQFAEKLVHVKGKWAGQHIRLEPFQAFILCSLFGWVKKRDNLRRFREAYCEIPRKNGKSVVGAIVGLYMFLADGEPGSEVYSGATTEKQAWEVFRPAKLMLEKSPGLLDHFGAEANAKNLYHQSSASRFEPLIGDPGDGSSPHCAIVDEYHEHQHDRLYNTMITGQGAREQSIQLVITTAGTNLSGPCYDKRDQIIKILSKTYENEDIFGIIYTIDEDDDWTDIENWKKANPNYGVSVFSDYLESRLKEATQRASRQNIIQCKHLNRWMNADTAWMNMLEWRKCADGTLFPENFLGEPCIVGVDLASKVDFAVLVQLFYREGHFYAFPQYFLPEDTVWLPENTHYQGWTAEERINVTPGAIIDYSEIEAALMDIAVRFELEEVAYDPFQATQFSSRMTSEGLTMVEVRPTVLNFSEPMKELEAAVKSGRFHYHPCPIFEWMAGNVVAHMDKKDNIYPNRERIQNKIDGIVATLMAMNRAILHGELVCNEAGISIL